MTTATTTKLQRVFRLGTTDLPDLDSELEPADIMQAYAEQYPNLKYGKLGAGEVIGDQIVYVMEPAQYKANG